MITLIGLSGFLSKTVSVALFFGKVFPCAQSLYQHQKIVWKSGKSLDGTCHDLIPRLEAAVHIRIANKNRDL
jgi:hypothetical protein